MVRGLLGAGTAARAGAGARAGVGGLGGDGRVRYAIGEVGDMGGGFLFSALGDMFTLAMR